MILYLARIPFKTEGDLKDFQTETERIYQHPACIKEESKEIFFREKIKS